MPQPQTPSALAAHVADLIMALVEQRERHVVLVQVSRVHRASDAKVGVNCRAGSELAMPARNIK
jgi:hypothetical protein